MTIAAPLDLGLISLILGLSDIDEQDKEWRYINSDAVLFHALCGKGMPLNGHITRLQQYGTELEKFARIDGGYYEGFLKPHTLERCGILTEPEKVALGIQEDIMSKMRNDMRIKLTRPEISEQIRIANEAIEVSAQVSKVFQVFEAKMRADFNLSLDQLEAKQVEVELTKQFALPGLGVKIPFSPFEMACMVMELYYTGTRNGKTLQDYMQCNEGLLQQISGKAADIARKYNPRYISYDEAEAAKKEARPKGDGAANDAKRAAELLAARGSRTLDIPPVESYRNFELEIGRELPVLKLKYNLGKPNLTSTIEVSGMVTHLKQNNVDAVTVKRIYLATTMQALAEEGIKLTNREFKALRAAFKVESLKEEVVTSPRKITPKLCESLRKIGTDFIINLFTGNSEALKQYANEFEVAIRQKPAEAYNILKSATTAARYGLANVRVASSGVARP